MDTIIENKTGTGADRGMATPSTPQRRSLWRFVSLLPFGLGAWGVAYAGIRARCTAWIALGGLWSATALAGWILAIRYPVSSWESALGGCLVYAAWGGAIVTSFVIRREYDRRMGIRPYCDRCGRYRESKRCACERRSLSSAKDAYKIVWRDASWAVRNLADDATPGPSVVGAATTSDWQATMTDPSLPGAACYSESERGR